MTYGIDSMLRLECLPLIREGVTAHYEGSIDKSGGNADWTWALYEDENKEWVLMDVEGPGCLYNFVQHRFIRSPEVTFRFYFDGERTPRFEIKNSQFGEKYPFIEPLASRYIGPPCERGSIRVVRSYVPMPFREGLKITSSLHLDTYIDKDAPGGGWGHVIYHRYASADGIQTFSPDDDVTPLVRLWKRAGRPPLTPDDAARNSSGAFTLAPGARKTVYVHNEAAAIIGIEARTSKYDRRNLSDLHIRATWDGAEKPDVDAPFGCFFFNELGYHPTTHLLTNQSADGQYANYFPMPFLRSAKIELRNEGVSAISFDDFTVTDTRAYNKQYADAPFGYFSSSPYYERKHTEGADSIIATLEGSGHLVASIITGFGRTPEARADCEGDVRVHTDGKRTPQIESDGSESYSSYGWGFPTPPEGHAVAGYDGEAYELHNNWSMTRHCIGDCYPFLSALRFGIESGGHNDFYMEHSGMVFFYAWRGGARLTKLIDIHAGDAERTSYFEGDDDDVAVTLQGEYGRALAFDVVMPPDAGRLILRRVSDQTRARQAARVRIDGAACPVRWTFADSNPIKSFLEDEYAVPEAMTRGKTRVHIDIEPEAIDEQVNWNQFGLQVYAVNRI